MVLEIVADGILCRKYGVHGTSMWDNIMIMYGTLQKETLRFGREALRFVCETPSHDLQVALFTIVWQCGFANGL